MIGKILLLLSVLLIIHIELICAGSGNKEHVHIKLHVPEVLKKHTHVRTIYKHHFKPKPKPKHKHRKERVHDRLDPSIHLGTLRSRYHPKPHWMANLMPAAKEESHEASYMVNHWHHNLGMLQQAQKKHKKNHSSYKLPVAEYATPSSEEESSEMESYPVKGLDDLKSVKENFGFQLQPRPTIQVSHMHFPQYRSSSHKKQHQPMVSDYMVMDSALSFGPSGTMDRHHDGHTSSSISQSHFKPPHLLKITEDDIRMKHTVAPTKTSHSSSTKWGNSKDPFANEPSAEELNFKTSTYEWPAERAVDLENYFRSTVRPETEPTGMMDDGHFPSFKGSSVLTKHHYMAGLLDDTSTASSDEKYSFPMEQHIPKHYQSFTKRKNKKNFVSHLNTQSFK